MELQLTSAERRALRARAHKLRPVVMIGEAGLTAAVLREIDANLNSHGLIKIRVLGDSRAARADTMARLCDTLEAAPVQEIGKILVVYRPQPEKEERTAPARARRKPPRRTKKSFQR